jgi:hypothetical protein
MLDAEIKAAVLAQAPPPLVTEGVLESAQEAPETTQYPVETDPTIANAGLTELNAPAATTITNGQEGHYDSQAVPQNAGFGNGAANAAAEANWDAGNDLSASQEWVEVPRVPAETDTGAAPTPAAPSKVQSWADDQPDSTEVRNFLSIVHELPGLVFDYCFLLPLG